VFVECLAGGLAGRDQRRRTGSGSALEALRNDALYKYKFTSLYYMTMGWTVDRDMTMGQTIEKLEETVEST